MVEGEKEGYGGKETVQEEGREDGNPAKPAKRAKKGENVDETRRVEEGKVSEKRTARERIEGDLAMLGHRRDQLRQMFLVWNEGKKKLVAQRENEVREDTTVTSQTTQSKKKPTTPIRRAEKVRGASKAASTEIVGVVEEVEPKKILKDWDWLEGGKGEEKNLARTGNVDDHSRGRERIRLRIKVAAKDETKVVTSDIPQKWEKGK